MKTTNVCRICKGTGMVVLASEYPNLIDSRWCHQCDNGEKFALLIDSIVARILKKVRAA